MRNILIDSQTFPSGTNNDVVFEYFTFADSNTVTATFTTKSQEAKQEFVN